jgi:hypothetical protein
MSRVALSRRACLRVDLAHPSGRKGGASMVPILLWILGVPGLIILLLLLFGVIHL